MHIRCPDRVCGIGLVSASLLFLSLLVAPAAQGQSPENWQQAVDYTMDITLHADEHQYTGYQEVTYTNNAPDTLSTLYYHLYFNAFEPTSMMAERNRQLPDPDGRIVPRIFNLGPDEQGWHRIRSLQQDGQAVDYDIHDTVMRVDLARPIPPGASTTFTMRWRAQVPLQTRRSGRDSRGGGVDFTMTQWYPKIAEYDERGWHADPYVNREFYAPYGSFDVEITLPSEYTVGATGLLQNPDAVGHGYDVDGSGTWRPEDGTPDADSLTWHFRAENVHDFAWAADPDYVHDKVEADGVTHHILYKPDVASSWTSLKDQMPRLTRFFEQKFGDYPYPQMTVAQGGDGGMEYPMFTAVAGYDNPEFEEKDGPRSILGTTVHEFAHMWYYAALGTNESDYAWMDEGFTTYATEEGMAHLTGRPANHIGSRQSVVYMQKMGLAEPFSTPADWFSTNLAYGITSYPGGQMLVDMLGYVIGDTQRDAWLRRYLRQREFQHPDPFDIELFAEQVSGLMLDWYFWQFTRSTRQLDDAIAGLSQSATGDGYAVDLTLRREGEIRMPHDVKLTLADGSTQWVNVPLLTMHGHKPVGDDWIVTEPWPWVTPEKTFNFTVPARVVKAELDPRGETPDVNRLNNTASALPPIQARIFQPPAGRWFDYSVGYRPLAQFAQDFGPAVGLQARGQYLFGEHETRAMFKLWPQVLASGGTDPAASGVGSGDASWFDGFDYELSYALPMRSLGQRATLTAAFTKKLGLLENRLTLARPFGSILEDGSQRASVALVHQFNRSDRVFRSYSASNPFRGNHLLSARLQYQAGQGRDQFVATAELGGSVVQLPDRRDAPSANQLSVAARKSFDAGPLTLDASFQFNWANRFLAFYKRPQLGGLSFEEQWQHDAFRSVAAAFERPLDTAHLTAFGPAGPVAYLRNDAGNASTGLVGGNLLAGRLTAHVQPFPNAGLASPFRLSLFSGVGEAWDEGAFLSGFSADALRADAGFGVSYDLGSVGALSRWTRQSDVLSGLNLTARFPVWAHEPDLTDPFAFRWLVGVQADL